jgi:hypothetical protein
MKITIEAVVVGFLAGASTATAIAGAWPRIYAMQISFRNSAALAQRYAICLPVTRPIEPGQTTKIIPGTAVCHPETGTTGQVLTNGSIGYIIQGDPVQLQTQLTQRGHKNEEKR